MLCIVETQISRARAEKIAGTIGYDNAFGVDPTGRSGGLCIFWNNEINIDILGYSCYHIDVKVSDLGGDPWRLTCFYGEANKSLRYNTWRL